MRERRSILVIGAGPGVSASVARLYADEQSDIGLVGLDGAALMDLSQELRGRGARVQTATVDIRDAALLSHEVARLCQSFGQLSVLHFNPSAFRESSPLKLTAADLAEDIAVGVGALLTALHAARPSMVVGSRVTATGSVAADRPSVRAASLGVQKAGLRNLVRSIDAELQSDGIRAVSITVNGALASEGVFTAERVAQAIFAAAGRPESTWTDEVVYG